MSDLATSIALARADFANELRGRGFETSGASELRGCVDTDAKQYPVRIELWPDFPFGPPRVFPPDDFPSSWHLQPGSGMCLYHGDDLSGLPWLDVDEFLELITRWFAESESGWLGDFPFLDLELYISRAEDEQRLVIYPDLARMAWVKLVDLGKCIMIDGRGSRPSRQAKPKFNRRLFGFVASIGEPERPVSNWDELARLLGEQREEIERAVRIYRIDILLVRYTRSGNAGVAVLKVNCDDAGVISIRSLRSASIDGKDITLRAGSAAVVLSEMKVAVVGAGAVGSHVADSLARSGIGTLGIIDSDIVKPGNLIRHTASTRHIGWNKADAVKNLVDDALFSSTNVVAASSSLLVAGDAEFLLGEYDLVIDATADGKATALLHHAAEVSGKRIVSVCLKEDGKVVRVDVLPPISGSSLPPTPESTRDPGSYVYEAGCGDPVSLTPHAAVLEAAALATRHAIGLLTGAPLNPAGEVRDYR